MPTKHISQREARGYKKRVAELEGQQQNRLSRWIRDYPGGVNLCQAKWDDADALVPVSVRVAMALGHPVVVKEDAGVIRFYGVKA